MGPVSFNTNLNDKEKRIECTFGKFAGDTRLSGAVGAPGIHPEAPG